MQFWLVRRTARERYLAAVIFTVVAALAGSLLSPWLGSGVPFLTLYPALFFSSLIGGGGPGLLSLALGVVISLVLWIPPAGSLWPATVADAAAILVFVFTGLGISYVAHEAWRLHLQLLDSNRELTEQRRRAEQGIEHTQRARLESDRQRRRTEKLLAQSRRLQTVSASFSRSLTSDDVMRLIMTEGIGTLNATAAFVSLLDSTGTLLHAVRSQGAPEDLMTRWATARVDESPARAEVIRENQPVYVRDLAEWQARYPQTAATSVGSGMQSFAMVPLESEGRAVGTIGLSFATPLPLDADDRVFLESLGSYCSIALERARAYEAERAARLDAEETNRLKDAFLATVSHELRTPLNAILGWAELLRRGVLPPDKQIRAVQAIGDNARRQAELTGDLLDMSRIIAGKVRLAVEPVEVAELIRRAVDVVQPAADAKGVELVVHAEPIAPLWSDPGRLQQILWNLLSNAVKFTPAAGRVDVMLTGTEAVVEIVIRDSGEGIPQAFLPHVFEPFRQGDESATRRRGGLGLGLSIVRHLVELHGGTVSADSVGEGEGSTFTVRLPTAARPPARDEADADAPVDARTPEASPALAGARVLLVENDVDSQDAMAIALRSFGAQVLTALSADEARAVLARERVDLLLVDIGLPSEDGYTLIRSIRAGGDRHARVPAAALTAYARPEDRAAAIAAGFDAHLVKPLDGTTLAAAVARLAGRAAARAAAPPDAPPLTRPGTPGPPV